MAALAAERERITLAVVFGDDAAGVEIIGHQPLIDDGELDRARGLREGGFSLARVARFGFEGEIAGPVGPYLRRAACERGHGADDMRQRLPIDRDGFGGVFGGGNRIGNHEGDGVADVAHLVAGQDRIIRDRNIDIGNGAEARQGLQLGDIGRGQHQAHTRHRPHPVEIDNVESAHGRAASAAPLRATSLPARRLRRSAPARAAARRPPCA